MAGMLGQVIGVVLYADRAWDDNFKFAGIFGLARLLFEFSQAGE